MRHILLLLLVLCIPVAATARDHEQLHYLGENSGAAIDPAAPRRLAYSQIEEPDWLAAGLTALSRARDGRKPVQHLLFRHDGAPTFLAVIWESIGLFDRMFVLYRVESTAPPRVRAVRTLEGAMFSMVEPSGHDIHGDGIATLFLEEGSGGTAASGYRLRIFKLTRTPADISPPYRPVIAEDLDGNGTWQVISSDDRWANFFFPCGQCGPLVPVVYTWRNGKYRMDCARHVGLIRSRIALFNEPEDFASWPLRDQTRLDMERALLHLQAAEAQAAQQLYHRAIDRLRQGGDDASPLLHQVLTGFGPLMERAPALSHRTCPVQSGKGGGHYADERD